MTNMDLDENSMNLDQESESDNDLLEPTTFLYSKKPLSEIKTPEKIKTPVGNTLSPITPLVAARVKQKAGSKKYSFRKLLEEKAAQVEAEKYIAKIEDMEEGKKEQGSFLDMILKDEVIENADDASSGDLQNYSDLLPQHRLELDKNIKKIDEGLVNDFKDGFVGAPLFKHLPAPADLTTPVFVQRLIGVDDYFSVQNTPQTEVDFLTKEFLISGHLVDMTLLKKAFDSSTIEWLLSCMCSSLDCDIIEGAFDALWAIFMSKDLKLDWQFLPKTLLHCLTMMGAMQSEFFGSKNEELIALLSKLKVVPGCLRSLEEPLDFLFLHSLQTLLKTYCCYLDEHPQVFTRTDKLINMLIALRLGITLEINACSWEIEVFLGSSINLYSEEEWKNELSMICKHTLEMTIDHSNKLQLVEMIPITERGREMKKVLSLVMMSSLGVTPKLLIEDPGKYLKKAVASEVLQLLTPIKICEETDFHQLFSFLSFVNHCTPEESISPSEKKSLESIISILRRLNGDIRDYGGYHLNRTKVKGLILRTVNRLSHIAGGLRTQASLDNYFGDGSNSFEQLKFETLRNQREKTMSSSDEEPLPAATHPACVKEDLGSSSKEFSCEETSDEDEAGSEDPLKDSSRS